MKRLVQILVLMTIFIYSFSGISAQNTQLNCVKNLTLSDKSVENFAQKKFYMIPEKKQLIKNNINETNDVIFYLDTVKRYFYNDSIVYNVYTFTKDGRILENFEIFKQFGKIDTNNRWLYKYNKAGKLISKIFETYNDAKERWYRVIESFYKYKDDTLLTSVVNKNYIIYISNDSIIYEWNDKKQLVKEIKYVKEGVTKGLKLFVIVEYFYDNKNNVQTIIRSYNDGKKVKTEYAYDQNNNIITEINSKYLDSIWVNNFKISITYNDKGDTTSKSVLEWRTDHWVNKNYYENKFDSNYNLIEQLFKKGNGNDWNNYKKIVNNFKNGEIDEAIEYRWESNQWLLHSKNKYKYNNDKLIEYDEYTLLDSIFIKMFSSYFTYDNNNNLIQISFKKRWNNRYDNYRYYYIFHDYFGNEYYFDGYKIEIGYTENSVSVNDNKCKYINEIYPNPATDFVFLSINKKLNFAQKINIYDINGKKYNVPIIKFSDYSYQLDVSNLLPGMYFIIEESSVYKFIKR